MWQAAGLMVQQQQQEFGLTASKMLVQEGH